ncbi:MAG: hypothetical protein EOO61_03440 [Hymenobacter sp.]|nr:MAG: hypothetical protein EOO61_03440 [Hymenobacter sp.]
MVNELHPQTILLARIANAEAGIINLKAQLQTLDIPIKLAYYASLGDVENRFTRSWEELLEAERIQYREQYYQKESKNEYYWR